MRIIDGAARRVVRELRGGGSEDGNASMQKIGSRRDAALFPEDLLVDGVHNEVARCALDLHIDGSPGILDAQDAVGLEHAIGRGDQAIGHGGSDPKGARKEPELLAGGKVDPDPASTGALRK